MLLDPTLLAMEKPSKLSYYLGAVKSGSPHNRLEACKAIIFRFNDLEGTKVLYDKLNQVDHPSVLKSMGLAKGVGDYKNYTFLALTPFDSTLAPYIQRHTGCDHNGRLTEEFITLVRYVFFTLIRYHNSLIVSLLCFCFKNLKIICLVGKVKCALYISLIDLVYHQGYSLYLIDNNIWGAKSLKMICFS